MTEETKNGQEAMVPMVVHDDSELANWFDSGRFAQLQRVAQVFASSDMVPQHFKGNAANCIIAVEMATRMNLAPMMFMQSSYVVHGKPGLDSKLAIALINTSGLFKGNLEYQREGDKPAADDYRVRAFAVRKDTGSAVYGPWIDWSMVKAEGWNKDTTTKSGYTQKSKWNTIPGLMFDYRAAMFFARTVCPERLLGMSTVEELQEQAEPAQVVQELPQEKPATLAEQVQPVTPEPEPAEEPVDDTDREAIKARLSELNIDFSDRAHTPTLKALLEQAEANLEQPSSTAAAPVEEPAPEEAPGPETAPANNLDRSTMMHQVQQMLEQHCDGNMEKASDTFAAIIENQFEESGVTLEQIAQISDDAMPLVFDAVKAFVGAK